MIKDKNAGGQILATAGSNVAIDAIVVGLMRHGVNVVRVGSLNKVPTQNRAPQLWLDTQHGISQMFSCTAKAHMAHVTAARVFTSFHLCPVSCAQPAHHMFAYLDVAVTMIDTEFDVDVTILHCG